MKNYKYKVAETHTVTVIFFSQYPERYQDNITGGRFFYSTLSGTHLPPGCRGLCKVVLYIVSFLLQVVREQRHISFRDNLRWYRPTMMI